MVRLKDDGVPIIGFTWYSLTDQMDWDTTLREDNGHVNPLGLYDLDRKIRPVGKTYRKLIRQWDCATRKRPVDVQTLHCLSASQVQNSGTNLKPPICFDEIAFQHLRCACPISAIEGIYWLRIQARQTSQIAADRLA